MKKVLAIVPFEGIYPPMSGGMIRCINLLNQLSKYFEVTIIAHQSELSFAQAFTEYPDLKKCTILSTKSFRAPIDVFAFMPKKIQGALRYRYWNRSLFGSAESHFLLIYPVLKEFLKKNKVDYIILEALFIVHATTKLIRRYQPDVHVIYNAYNVDSKLAAIDFKNGKISEKNYKQIAQEESHLSDSIDEIFVCSDQDCNTLTEMNNRKLKGVVIPNGVKISDSFSETQNEILEKNCNILFCGSMDYFPNQEGLTWFCKEIFPLILKKNPFVKLLVVGRGDPGKELHDLLQHDSIIFFGMVDKVVDYYKKAAIAIVPLLSGSGTRLKLLEAMGYKIAVVSTRAGAEGIDYTEKKNIIIADDNFSFAESVIELLNDKLLADSIASSAYTFVQENYDWNVIGKKLDLHLNGIDSKNL